MSALESVREEEPSVPPAVSAQDILERVAARLRHIASQQDGAAGHALTMTADALEAEAKDLDR